MPKREINVHASADGVCAKQAESRGKAVKACRKVDLTEAIGSIRKRNMGGSGAGGPRWRDPGDDHNFT